MEIDITSLLDFDDHDLRHLTGSVAELGNDAAKITWNRALDKSKDFKLTDEQLNSCRLYFKTFGAWSKEELFAMSDKEITALFLQHVSLEYKENPDFTEGNIFQTKENKFYIYIGE